MPLTSFCEYDTVDGKMVPTWFALDESRPLMVFAGIWTNWTSVRKVKEGEVNGWESVIRCSASIAGALDRSAG